MITEESKNNELKKDKDKLLESFTTFNTNKININKKILKDKNKNLNNRNDTDYLDKLLIKECTKNTLYKDLNKWLLNYNKKFYESVTYFTGRLMYSLNSYAKKNSKYFIENKTTLYRGIKIPYSCLLPYERAIGKIILLTAFTSTAYKEKEVLFQPFSFYFVTDVKIDLKLYTADIYLETVGKTIILEEGIKKGKGIIYNESTKIIELNGNNNNIIK